MSTDNWRTRADERYRRISGSVIWQLLGRQRRWLVALMFLAICSFTVAVGVAVTIQDAVDFALVEKVEPLDRYIELLVGLAFLGFVFGFPFRQVTARLGFHLEYELRVWVYERLQAMHPTVLDALASGQAMTRAMSDLTMLELATLLVPDPRGRRRAAARPRRRDAVAGPAARHPRPAGPAAELLRGHAHPQAALRHGLHDPQPAGRGHHRHRRGGARRPGGEGLRPGGRRAGPRQGRRRRRLLRHPQPGPLQRPLRAVAAGGPARRSTPCSSGSAPAGCRPATSRSASS